MFLRDSRLWAVWHDMSGQLMYCSINRSDCRRYLNLIPDIHRPFCKIVRYDVAKCYL